MMPPNAPEQLVDPPPQRLKILGDDEIAALYGLPRLTPEQRIEYFSLSARERSALETLGTIQSRIYFLLQLGYFKARQMFFAISAEEVQEDIRYILETHFPSCRSTHFAVSKNTQTRHQLLILELCSYRACDSATRQQLEAKACQAARICGKPIFVFREVVQIMADQRIVSPAYSSLQDLVGKALTDEQNRMIAVIRQRLRPSDAQALSRLLDDPTGLHEITQLKREPKDFSATEIKREIERGHQIRELYQLSLDLLPALELSNESVKYFASLVTYYTAFRLKRFDPSVVYIYLLCFVHHRYQRHHDNLLASFIYSVRRFHDQAKEAAKQRVYEHRLESNRHLQKAGQILRLFVDDRIAETEPFDLVRAKAFAILDRDQIESVADHITTRAGFDETAFQWDCVEALAGQFKRHLRPILRAVSLKGSTAQSRLIEAVDFLRTAWSKGRALGSYSDAKLPIEIIKDSLKRYVYTSRPTGENQLCADRYEFLIYRLVRERLEAGDLFCRDSVRFRSFEDDLIDDEQWRDKDRLIDLTGLTILKQPIQEHLDSLEQELEDLIEKVNQRIESGENEHFKIRKHGSHTRWSLPYPDGPEEIHSPLFESLKQVDVGSVLEFVNGQCRWMDTLEHVLHRYVKQEADERAMIASLLAWGTNMGLGTMGQISDIGYHTLAATSDHFIRLETLREANDRITNAIVKMPLFRHFDIDDAIHSSSDGQKFETGINTINARHSPKYFGLKKGVVAYTLVANHIPVNARIIGANEHESHYVFDILFNNSSQVQSDVHSTDTHGTNEVNFALLHLFGYQFAPRYRDIFDRVSSSLYGFKHPSQYHGLIKPVRKIDKKRIIDNWDHAQRIILSLALKTTTQSIIVGKLNSYPRRNRTRQALWEYDNIIKSLYLLRYIDSPPLRRNVQKALNRGESYHQLRRSVAYANFGKLRFKTEYEQQIWGECSRLITNCIIFYNTTLLSRLLDHGPSNQNPGWAERIKNASPVAWQHINFYGRYEFAKESQPIDMAEMIQQLVKRLSE